MLQLLILLAEETPKQSAPGPFAMELPLIMLVIFALLFFIVIRPAQKRQERERQTLLASLKKNDRVITTAGIYGTIVSVSDKEDEVIVKVDDNTRLKMLKSSILRNLNPDDSSKTETK